MRAMLRAVTQKGGTAEKLQLPGYRFAGKTGTAQKVDPVTRHYSTDKWASSFVGLRAPRGPAAGAVRDDRRAAGTHYGSMVAGPVFAEVMAMRCAGWACRRTRAARRAGDAQSRRSRAKPATPPTVDELEDDDARTMAS